MSTATYDQLSTSDRKQIEAMVQNQLDSMNHADKQIVYKTREALAYYVANAIKSAAAVLGYVIALPLAYAELALESFATGFSDGFSAAFRDVRRGGGY